jgi:hypothetical protein
MVMTGYVVEMDGATLSCLLRIDSRTLVLKAL